VDEAEAEAEDESISFDDDLVILVEQEKEKENKGQEQRTKSRVLTHRVGKKRCWVHLLIEGPVETQTPSTTGRPRTMKDKSKKVWLCKLNAYPDLCYPTHKKTIAFTEGGHVSNVKSHFKTHHRSVFEAMQYLILCLL